MLSESPSYRYRILLSGVTGALGRILLPLLATSSFSDYQFIFIVRRNLPYQVDFPPGRFLFSYGDASSPNSWVHHIEKFSPHRVAILSNIRHFTSFRIALNHLSIDSLPLLLIGSTGLYSSFDSYSAPYRLIEKKLLNYPKHDLLLLRPSLIFGTIDDKNYSAVVRFIRKFRFFFVVGSGNNLVHPLCYQDLANVISHCLLRSSIVGSFDLSGSHCISSIDLIRLLFVHSSLNPLIFRIPLKLALFVAFVTQNILPSSLLSVERVLRQTEDKCFDHSLASRVLDFYPRNLFAFLPEYCSLF